MSIMSTLQLLSSCVTPHLGLHFVSIVNVSACFNTRSFLALSALLCPSLTYDDLRCLQTEKNQGEQKYCSFIFLKMKVNKKMVNYLKMKVKKKPVHSFFIQSIELRREKSPKPALQQLALIDQIILINLTISKHVQSEKFWCHKRATDII